MNTITHIDPTIIPERISPQDLVTAAGSNVARPRVQFVGQVFDGTKAHQNTPMESISGYQEAIYSEFEQVTIKEEFPGYTFAETAAALAAVLNRSTEGIPQPHSNDPNVRPSTRIVDVGFDWDTGEMRQIVVPDGEMTLPGFRTLDPRKWQPTMQVIIKDGSCFIIANILRQDQDKANGVFHYVRQWANRNSIYIGQCVDQNFDFVKLTDHDPHSVALTDSLRKKTERIIVGRLLHQEAYDAKGVPPKSGLFLYGPPGGGKTMAKTNCLYLGARLGAVVIDVDPSTGMTGFNKASVRSKRLLDAGHAVVIAMEDMEKLTSMDRAKILDLLDGSAAKGQRRITIGTTNFIEQIDPAMLRPGRFKAVEFCGLPDLSAFTQLVNVLISEDDRGDIDYAEAFPHFEGYSYAFIASAVEDIMTAAIVRCKGNIEQLSVTTEDLIDAAVGLRDHFDLMQQEVVKPKPELDQVFGDIVHEQVSDFLSSNSVITEDNTDYGYIEERVRDAVDSVVEGRIHGAMIEDSDGNESRIHTN